MIEAEFIQIRKFLWASLIVTLLSTLYWSLGVSNELKSYLGYDHKPIVIITSLNVFFNVLLPVIGFIGLVAVNVRVHQIEKFRRHDSEINKLKRFRNLLLIGFIVLMGRGLVFLIYSA